MSRKLPRYKDFLTIKNQLEKKSPVQVFEIGGIYIQGYVDTIVTMDIDIVIIIASSISKVINEIKSVLGNLGYKFVSQTKSKYYRFVTEENLKLDIFINEDFTFTISSNMLSRVKNQKLLPEDVFLLKAQSTRGLDKDYNDLKLLISDISKGKFDYQIITTELEDQLQNNIIQTPQNINRLLTILEAVEQLNEMFPVDIPITFLNEIERIYSLHGIL
jgi:hypothetical protein